MSEIELPQLSAPFTLARTGPVVVEQGSLENERSNIYNIATCFQGTRDDLPDFGIPDPTFETMPVNLAPLEEALRKYEPAADLSVAGHRAGLAEAGIVVTVS